MWLILFKYVFKGENYLRAAVCVVCCVICVQSLVWFGFVVVHKTKFVEGNYII